MDPSTRTHSPNLGPRVLRRVIRRPLERLQSRFARTAFERRWGFPPPPAWSDWVGYEAVLEEIERFRIAQVAGDVLEIGCLLGGGTAKLCGWFRRHAPSKRVIAVDVFDPAFDPTFTTEGWPMRELYLRSIGSRDQRTVFDSVTGGCTNLIVVAGDSTTVELPTDLLAFAFVDGSHVPEVVRSDFESVWSRLAPGGIVAFHDYGGDLPGVTKALHERIAEHVDEIERLWTRSPTLLFLQRSTGQETASC